MKDEKLQKALARMGLGSRRQMEEVIKAGRGYRVCFPLWQHKHCH